MTTLGKSGTAVFGYGSLAHVPSLSLTLGREPAGMALARLPGWRRRWSVFRDNRKAEKTFARLPGGEIPPFILGLNVEPSTPSDAGPNGVLIEVSDAELTRIDLREMRYDRVDVTDLIPSRFERVITYAAKAGHYAPVPPAGAVIIGRYAGAVEKAFRLLGDEQLALYRETTGPLPVEAIDAELIDDEIPPGNPRGW